MNEVEDLEGAQIISGKDFDLVIHGISENDQIIVLVDDHIYGACSYAIKEYPIVEGVGITVDIITTGENVTIPVERQQVIVEAVLFQLMPESSAQVVQITDPIEADTASE